MIILFGSSFSGEKTLLINSKVTVEFWYSDLQNGIVISALLLFHGWYLDSAQSLVVSDSLWSHGLQLTRLLCLWDCPRKNTRVGCHFLLQEIFPTQGLNSGLLHWQAGSLRLSHPGIPEHYLLLHKSFKWQSYVCIGMNYKSYFNGLGFKFGLMLPFYSNYSLGKEINEQKAIKEKVVALNSFFCYNI